MSVIQSEVSQKDKNKHMNAYMRNLGRRPRGHLVVKNLPADAGDMGSIPGLERYHVPWRH